jgi:hypothetical protein
MRCNDTAKVKPGNNAVSTRIDFNLNLSFRTKVAKKTNVRKHSNSPSSGDGDHTLPLVAVLLCFDPLGLFFLDAIDRRLVGVSHEIPSGEVSLQEEQTHAARKPLHSKEQTPVDFQARKMPPLELGGERCIE